MNLEKAKEILAIYKADGEAACGDDLDDAMQLGIEALKAWELHRKRGLIDKYWLLPGETEE